MQGDDIEQLSERPTLRPGPSFGLRRNPRGKRRQACPCRGCHSLTLRRRFVLARAAVAYFHD